MKVTAKHICRESKQKGVGFSRKNKKLKRPLFPTVLTVCEIHCSLIRCLGSKEAVFRLLHEHLALIILNGIV